MRNYRLGRFLKGRFWIVAVGSKEKIVDDVLRYARHKSECKYGKVGKQSKPGCKSLEKKL